MRRFVLGKGVVITLTIFSLVVGGIELTNYYSPSKPKSEATKPMQFSNVMAVEIIRTSADLTIRYHTRDGQMMPLSFPGVTVVVVKDLRPLAEANGKGKK